MIEVGKTAPDFCLPNQDDVEICLRDLRGKWIVLYFYPKDNTPGCTTEACDFTQTQIEFADMDAIIMGVSADSTLSHQKFIEKHDLEVTLLSDPSTKMMQDYDVWKMKKNYGKEYMGIVRTTYIVSPEGKIAAGWDNVKVRVKRKKDGETIEKLHVNEVKEKLNELRA
ncbi:peroxiredoxin [Sulfurimonas sp. HSL-1716]|uniref:peroxiredoxin n=1 Tax=Hydrocurvibacter sulfurireducens TaxID=3131937 RepID=UPI0031F94796